MTTWDFTALYYAATLGLLLLNLYYMKDLKRSLNDAWKRIYDHYHEVECENKDCKKLKTGNVIVPGHSK